MSAEMEVTAPIRRERSAPKPWQMGKVVELIDETPETRSLRILVPEPSPYTPGQYYNVRLPIEGKPRPIQRAYSLGSSPFPDPSVIEMGIREISDGLISPILVRQIRVGDEIEVRGPFGSFTWTEELGGPVLLVGAGSGVVPLMAMIRYQVEKGTSHKMHLLFSSKSREFVIYREELERLEAKYDWLEVSHTFTRDSQDPAARFHRRIDKDMLAEVSSLFNPKVAYICGPPEVVEGAEEILLELGLPRESVFTEKYD
ncbi:MAG: FAD-binding oxidoreductase [Actinomycetota bacterium]|nr:FAD-binding oxidoreductase [Actinomycetota bacterium]